MKTKRLLKGQASSPITSLRGFTSKRNNQTTSARAMCKTRTPSSSQISTTRHMGPGSQQQIAIQSKNCIRSRASISHKCFGCKELIKDRYLLEACDKYWHDGCLKCDRCEAKLGHVGVSLFRKANLNLCRKDYLEMFGQTAICSVCDKLIHASEMVMRAQRNVYHLECFACQLCCQRFCVGDRFYLCENKIVCQYDFEEHVLPIQKSLLSSNQLQHQQQSDNATSLHETSLRDLIINLTSNSVGSNTTADVVSISETTNSSEKQTNFKLRDEIAQILNPNDNRNQVEKYNNSNETTLTFQPFNIINTDEIAPNLLIEDSSNVTEKSLKTFETILSQQQDKQEHTERIHSSPIKINSECDDDRVTMIKPEVCTSEVENIDKQIALDKTNEQQFEQVDNNKVAGMWEQSK